LAPARYFFIAGLTWHRQQIAQFCGLNFMILGDKLMVSFICDTGHKNQMESWGNNK